MNHGFTIYYGISVALCCCYILLDNSLQVCVYAFVSVCVCHGSYVCRVCVHA